MEEVGEEEDDLTEEIIEEEMEVEEEAVEEEKEAVPKSTPNNCTVCSDRSVVHSEAECLLSQTDVPGRLLTYRSKDDDADDLGDLAIRAGTVDGLLVKATQASVNGGECPLLFLNFLV